MPATSFYDPRESLHGTPSTGDLPRPAGNSGPGSCGVSAFALGPGVRPPRVKSLFPPILWSSCSRAPLAFKVNCCGYSSSWCWTPRHSVELRALTPVGKLLWYNYSPVCGSPTQVVWDLIISWERPSYYLMVSSLCLWIQNIFFWKIPVFFLIDSCSAVSCDFDVFLRARYFCSAILSLNVLFFKSPLTERLYRI